MNRSRTFAAVLSTTGALLLAACEPAPTGPIQPLTELPRALTASERTLIANSNVFAFDLMRVVNAGQERKNVFVSPLSVSMALGMTMNGAGGATFEEMRETLGFAGLTQVEINESYRDLTDLLLGLDRTVEIGIANSIWYRDGFPFESSFFRTVGSHFDAHVAALDFADPRAADRINEWVRTATRRRIDGIVDEIRPDHVMFLINAIYFKGIWSTRFDKARTRSAPFTDLDGGTAAVAMMNNEATVRYRRSAEFTVVELPYGNGAFVMTIVLPAEGEDVNAYLASLDANAWERILSGMTQVEADVSLPRFRLEYERSLVQPLQALGMKAAFVPGVADFSGLSSAAARDLVIDEIKHKTFVEVNEEGTEAAAVTSVEMVVTSMPVRPTIRIDRPFVFAIRERFSGTILFAGKIVAPSDEHE